MKLKLKFLGVFLKIMGVDHCISSSHITYCFKYYIEIRAITQVSFVINFSNILKKDAMISLQKCVSWFSFTTFCK
jgi:hypothetical protein